MQTNKERLIEKLKTGNYTSCTLTIQNKDMHDFEAIIFNRVDFENKANYIDKAYDDNLTLKSYDRISIINVKFENHYVAYLHLNEVE